MKKLSSSVGFILALASSTAWSAPVTTWEVTVNTRFDTTSILPTTGITVNSDKSLRWGTPAGNNGQSGLDITDSPSTTYVDTNGAPVANVSVTHLNRPITGTSLDSVDILSTLTLKPFAPSGTALPDYTITFKVDFEETLNTANPCADGGANGSGVNANGCADIFVIDKNALNFEFFYDDPDGEMNNRPYYISFFELTNGLNPLPTAACEAATGSTDPCLGFETPEEQDTTFQFASVITTEPVSVPEPGLLAMIGTAMGMFGLVRRRMS